MKKSLSLFATIIAGLLVPQAADFSFLIYYLLMVMLFFSLLNFKVSLQIFFKKNVYLILWANLVIGLFSSFLLWNINQNYALTAFLVGMTPTATACPAVMDYLGGKVDFAVATVFITNLFMALFLPAAIYLMADHSVEIYSIFFKTVFVIVFPMLLGMLVKTNYPQVFNFLIKKKDMGFYAWLIVCFLSVSKASAYLQAGSASIGETLVVAAISGFICFINFGLGRILGGKKHCLEMSQTLGQKNTTLTIWIGLSYFNPLIALGPICYLIFHNLYNAYQLSICEKKRINLKTEQYRKLSGSDIIWERTINGQLKIQRRFYYPKSRYLNKIKDC